MLLFVLSSASARADFDYISGWDGQLFPSYIVATATMRPDENQAVPDLPDDGVPLEGDEQDAADTDQDQGDGENPVDGEMEEVGEADDGVNFLGDPDSMGLVGVVVTAEEDDTPIDVEIEAPGIIEVSRWSGTLEKANTEYTVLPALKFNFKALMENTQSVPLAITYRVWLGDNDLEEHTVNVTLRSINDCPNIIKHSQDNIEDLSYMFAAYVNEQHPFVDKILRESLENGVVEAFAGYQSANPEDVIRQVYSIWDALSRRDVRYSSITASAAVNKMVISQHVRFIDQSINNAQANCVDGSALMASLLRKIEIEPALVLVPGHCYLAFALDPQGKRWMGLETTLVGKKKVDVPPDEESDKIVDTKFQRENSWRTRSRPAGRCQAAWILAGIDGRMEGSVWPSMAA
jgi:hypothetical protein